MPEVALAAYTDAVGATVLVTAAKPLPSAAPGGSAANPNANPALPITGQKKVASTGTALAIAASTPVVNGVIVTALDTNGAKVTTGPSGVNNTTDGTGNGYVLAPGQSIGFSVTDLASVFINGTVGDGVSFAGN